MRSLLLPTLVVALPFLLTGGARAQDETKAIIDKAIKAHGGEDNLVKLQQMRIKSKGTMVVMGMNVSVQRPTERVRCNASLGWQFSDLAIVPRPLGNRKDVWQHV